MSLRTTAPHGVSVPEHKRLSGALHFMFKEKPKGAVLYWAVIGDNILSFSPAKTHKEIGKVKSRISQLQNRAGLPTYWVQVSEVSGGLHGNIVFPANEKIAGRLEASYPQYFKSKKAIQPVDDVHSLVSYLGDEIVPQGMHLVAHRKKGSHRCEGLGDRVTLSKDLEIDATEAKAILPLKRTNNKRQTVRKSYRSRRLNRAKAMRPAGQLELFPALAVPPARLKDYQGGILPPCVALEIEFQRKQHHWSQSQLGDIAGLSQPQIANAVAGRFGLSRGAVNRLKDALAA